MRVVGAEPPVFLAGRLKMGKTTRSASGFGTSTTPSTGTGETRPERGVRDQPLGSQQYHLQVLAETGVIGAFAWLWLFVSSLRTCWKIRRRGLEKATANAEFYVSMASALLGLDDRLPGGWQFHRARLNNLTWYTFRGWSWLWTSSRRTRHERSPEWDRGLTACWQSGQCRPPGAVRRSVQLGDAPNQPCNQPAGGVRDRCPAE